MKKKEFSILSIWLMSVFVLAMITVGCSKFPPGESKVKNDLTAKLQEAEIPAIANNGGKFGRGSIAVKDIYKITRLTKTNGAKKGEQNYKAEFEGELQFLKDVYVYSDGTIFSFPIYSLIGRDAGFSNKLFTTFNKGQTVAFKGTVSYELTDNGWRYTRHSIETGEKYFQSF